MRVGVVGLGYWGPNLARNFDRLAETELAWICDESEQARERWGAEFPRARVAADLDELLADSELDAVVGELAVIVGRAFPNAQRGEMRRP